MPERTSLTIADAELTDLRAITIRQPWATLVAAGVPEPVPCKGQQAVPWRVPEDVAAKVREYVEEAGQ